ncbi:MAG: hypothetical protein IT342_09315 [Candidatus Melainabacteria bacterium]|nr:hypothetical protein [Candidatus Melainabacteria bacterium]
MNEELLAGWLLVGDPVRGVGSEFEGKWAFVALWIFLIISNQRDGIVTAPAGSTLAREKGGFRLPSRLLCD